MPEIQNHVPIRGIQVCSVGICGIVVTFRPDLIHLEHLLLALLPQVNDIVVVDNSGTPEVRNLIHDRPALQAIHLLETGRNLGIAAAQNRGIDWARQRNHTDVLLMDQDSLPKADMVHALLDARRQLTESGHRVSAVGPVCVDVRDGHQGHLHLYGWAGWKNVTADKAGAEGVMPADMLAASGSLISLELIGKVGAMDESLFIDHVDTEWYLRAKAEGFQAFASCRAVLQSNLGDKTFRFWLGRWRYAPLHTPVRHYYMLRNSILLMSRGYVPFGWKLYAARQALASFVFYSLVGKSRRQHCLNMWRGLYDGLRSRSGPFD